MKKILLLISLIILTTMLIGCQPTSPANPQPTNQEAAASQTILEQEEELVDEPKEPPAMPGVSLTLDEAKQAFSIVEVNYLGRGEENARGDRSSVRHIPGTKLFEARAQLVYDFVPAGVPEGATYVKILGRGENDEANSVRFETALERGNSKSMIMNLILKNPGEESRLSICFGGRPDFDPLAPDAVCINKLVEGPTHVIEVNVQELRLRFDIKDAISMDEITTTKSLHVKNQGNAPTTFFFYIPSETTAKEENRLEVPRPNIYLQPQEEAEFDVVAYLTYEGIDIHGYADAGLYAVPEECSSPLTCYENARYKKDISLELYD